MLRAYDDFHGLTSDVHRVGKLYGVFDIGTIAGQWFSAMRRAGRLRTYAEFETEFRSHFSMTKSDKFVLHKQLRTFVQRDTDGVQTYYTNLQRIFTDLWAVGCEYSHEMKVIHFVCGLQKTIGDRVQADLIRDSGKLDADFETTYSLALSHECSLPGARPGTVSEYNGRTNQAITSSERPCMS